MNKRMIRFGENLKILRSKNNLTQEDLAKKLFVTRQAVSKWETKSVLPDLKILSFVHQLFDVPLDEIMYGRVKNWGEHPVRRNEADYLMALGNEKRYIKTIEKKGYYDILDDDIEEFLPLIPITFSKIMAIVLELKERSYNISNIFSNGFGIYFYTDDQANLFQNDLSDIIDSFIHYDGSKVATEFSDYSEGKINETENIVLREVELLLYGEGIKYYWIDKSCVIRGYGSSVEVCKEQAFYQNCDNYTVLEVI